MGALLPKLDQTSLDVARAWNVDQSLSVAISL